MKKSVYSVFIGVFCFLAVSCSKDPEACFTYTANDNGVVNFSSSCSENAENYDWSFGEAMFFFGSFGGSSSANPTYDYFEAGSYNVTLEVSRKDKKDSETQTVTIDEYCVECDGYSDCFRWFKNEAEERADSMNESGGYSNCKAVKK